MLSMVFWVIITSLNYFKFDKIRVKKSKIILEDNNINNNLFIYPML